MLAARCAWLFPSPRHTQWLSRRFIMLGRASYSAGSNPDTTQVCVLDPRAAFQSCTATAASVVRLSVPDRFLPQVSSPQFAVGEADDPMTSWIFGKHGEIFEYSFVGNVRTQSGWVSCITQQALDELTDSKGMSWEDLQSAAANAEGGLKGPAPGQPFLFVGQILEAGAAGVYEKREGGELQGLLITTNDDEISTP